MPVHSNREAIDRRMRDAASKALTGAAQLYRNAMQESLRNPPEGGYTTGAWDHGMAGVAGSVAVSEPVDEGDAISIGVGTNVVYAKFWEFGHINLFTRQFERVERWRPTLEATAPAMVERFRKLFGALMGSGTAG
jgi:hypothetical protein